nr:mrna 3'-end-processing protein rna14 [Quercus suber]
MEFFAHISYSVRGRSGAVYISAATSLDPPPELPRPKMEATMGTISTLSLSGPASTSADSQAYVEGRKRIQGVFHGGSGRCNQVLAIILPAATLPDLDITTPPTSLFSPQSTAMDEYDPAAQGYGDEGASYADDEVDYSQQEHDGANDEDDASDYDPSSFQFDHNTTAANANPTDADSRPASTLPHPIASLPPKPKTAGGFLLEDSDDEDEEVVVPSQQNGIEGAVSEAAPDISSVASAHLTDTAAPANSSITLNGSTSVPVPDSATVQVPSTLPTPSLQPDAAQGNSSAVSAPTPQPQSTPRPVASAAAPTPQSTEPHSIAQPTQAKRLPIDKLGRLEDRVKEDPRGDVEAWVGLIDLYIEKGQLGNIRTAYERFFAHFPTSPRQWCQWILLEIEHKDEPGSRVDQTLQEAFGQCLCMDLVKIYIEYIRRIHPLVPDPNGENRGTVLQAFEYILSIAGNDPESGWLWVEYIDFVKAGPGVIGGSNWQDQQKADQVRKAYQRAIKIPHANLAKLWKEYDHFENGLDRAAGRRFLQDQSPHYMTARTAWTQLEPIMNSLDRMSIPPLPPLHGFDGDLSYSTRVTAFKAWIEFEKRDELVLREENISLYRDRILYAYTQANMSLRFFPQIWFDAAGWCFEQDTKELSEQGEALLDNGIRANPESVLLALTKSDRVEQALDSSTNDETAIANGLKLDVPFETAHAALYSLREKHLTKEKKEKTRIEEEYAAKPAEDVPEENGNVEDSDDEDATMRKPKTRDQAMKIEIETVQAQYKAVINDIKQLISYLWVAKLRAFRRIQGQGVPNKPKKGFRGVFAEARLRGQLSSDVYIANALMEWHCYKDPASNKIFERGLKLFPTDEVFALEYIKHLISINDHTNARAVFETTITKISNSTTLTDEQKTERCAPLFDYMYESESKYGDLQQIHKLLKRMANAKSPAVPPVVRLAQRYELSRFDGTTCQIVISPTQIMPQGSQHAREEQSTLEKQTAKESVNDHLRLGKNGPYVASPKRPLEDSEDESPARKFIRAESPLKGAAGRRIQGHSANNSVHVPPAAEIRSFPPPQLPSALPSSNSAAAGFAVKNFAPLANPLPAMPPPSFSMPPSVPTLPQDIKYILSILPNARYYHIATFDPVKMVDLLRRIEPHRAVMPATAETRFA